MNRFVKLGNALIQATDITMVRENASGGSRVYTGSVIGADYIDISLAIHEVEILLQAHDIANRSTGSYALKDCVCQ